MTPQIYSLKEKISNVREVARRRHRNGESAFLVVQGISDGIDGLLRSVFTKNLRSVADNVALVAVGGYGRRELCPYSDTDLMFLCDDLEKSGEVVERVVRTLFDAGFDPGHSVRSPAECLHYMKEDDVTAATLLESRFLTGSERLMRLFQEKSLNRYKKRDSQRFASAKLASLKNSLEGPGRTIFVTEPHIKEGLCCMRDVQHILWIERSRRHVASFQEMAHHGGFSLEEVSKLEQAYEFFLKVRCELHFHNGFGQDILEIEAQSDVADALRYIDDESGRGVEKLMGDFYRHARNVRSFARHYIETKSRGVRFLAKLRHRFLASKVNENLSLLDGRLYLSEEPAGPPQQVAEMILDVFLVAQMRDAEISQSLCEWIRGKLTDLAIDFTRSETVSRAFLSIMAGGPNTGKILRLMHETGVLGRIIPEFEKLNCLVTFDGHHQFTVDAHTLRCLRELDRIQLAADDYPEPEFCAVLKNIDDQVPLRFALLLHDIGKSSPGSHDVKGTEAAAVICERLGLDASTIENVVFLVYRHLAMFRFSERIDFSEDSAVDKFVGLVRSRSNLDMLYLLTYIDITSVGPGTWTAWKGAQLSDLYNKAAIHLECGSLPTNDLEEELANSGIDGDVQREIVRHCGEFDENPSYWKAHVPERMLLHVKMIDIFRNTGVPQVRCDQMVGCYDVTFCERDRRHLFIDYTGLLYGEGFDILGAGLYSRRDGIALDCFQVRIADQLRVSAEKRIVKLRRKLERMEAGGARISRLVRKRRKLYGLHESRRPFDPPRVRFHDDLSRTNTVIEVEAGDRPGLLYDLATAIAAVGLDLRTAKVSTLIDRARDFFYVVESGGGKVLEGPRRDYIEHQLLRAADPSRKGGVQGTPTRSR